MRCNHGERIQMTAKKAFTALAAAIALASSALAGSGDKASLPVYVNAYSVDHEFDIVTPECLNALKSKRILFGSRSWGLVIGGYMTANAKATGLKWQNFPTKINDSNRVLPANVFDSPQIVHFLFEPQPKRWAYMDDFLRKGPWNFGPKIDGCFQSLYNLSRTEPIDDYFSLLDSWIKDFPNVKFAVFTHPVSASGKDMKGKDAPEDSAWNVEGGEYSEKAIRRYYGKIPIFDIRDIVSTAPDGTLCEFTLKGKTYRKLCPEYNTNQDMIHPNSPLIKERIGKGFMIFLVKTYCADLVPPEKMKSPVPAILSGDASHKAGR